MSAIVGPTSMSLDGTRNNRLQVLQPDGKTYKQAAWHRIDYRYRMPDLYESRSEMRVYDFAFMKPCFCFCMHYYSDCSMSAVIFGGWANISARVDRDKYIKYRWTLPPFGNKGRDLLERFLSQDCVMHEVLYQMPFDTDEDGNPITDADGNPLVEYRIPEPDFEWMPMVMDHSMFFMSFNSFDSNGETLDLVSENLYGFNFVNQLNFMTLSNITETIDSVTRYSFDDVFDIRFEEKCTYPLPLLPKGDSGSSVAFYTFKEDSTAWAWQETWKQIERAKEGTEQIKCVRLVRPNYIYDAYKKEHSVICSEGMHTIHLRGYNPEEKKDAQISLDGVNYRSFDIIYGNPSGGTWTYDSESYNADYVDWLDVGGGGDTGGSSKSDNIYEVTSDENDWAHPKNMIFSVEASKEKLDSRKITKINESGSESHQYYNRGLVAQIRKDFLEFLPKNFYECTLNGKDAAFNLTGGKFGCALTGPAQYNWQGTYSLLPGKFIFNTSTVSFASEDSITPCNIASISIEGYYGRINTTNLVTKKASNLSFVQPGISITAKTEDGDEYTLRGFASNSVTPKTLNMHKDTKSFTENYSAKFLLPLSPIEMVKKRITKFTINLFGLPDYFIAINNLKVEFAEYKKEASEDVFVWERKYNISQYSPEDELNPDGPSYILKSDIDESNAGQYFSFSELYKTESKLLTNKIRGALFERSIEDDEAVPITIDTVLDVEKEKQKELYTAAYDLEDLKELNYNTMLPDTIFKNLPESATGGVSGGCKITIPKIPWDSLKLVKEFVQFPLWRVNGHRFVWADQYNEEPCRERQFYYGVHLHEH